jgi:hypothetical protein
MAADLRRARILGKTADWEIEILRLMTDALTIRVGLEICALRKSAAILKKHAQQGAGSRSLDRRRGLDEYLFIFRSVLFPKSVKPVKSVAI